MLRLLNTFSVISCSNRVFRQRTWKVFAFWVCCCGAYRMLQWLQRNCLLAYRRGRSNATGLLVLNTVDQNCIGFMGILRNMR